MATLQGDRMLMVVDGDAAQSRFIASLAARAGWRTLLSSDAAQAIAMLGTHDGLLVDAVMIDGQAVRSDLSHIIVTMQEWRPSLPVLFVGEPGRRALALDALRAGASDILDKPLSAERLAVALDQALGPQFTRELRPLSEKFEIDLPIEEIIGSAPGFRTALAIAAKAARVRVPILIEGAVGTGKALLAQAIHAAGQRPRAPYIELDCGHHSPALIGPRLFGYEQGAFAGAFERRTGELSRADGGTIVVDRIERMPPDAQALLASFLETGLVVPLGGGVGHAVDVRLISTSQVDLRKLAAEGLFREDLLARISVAEVSLPELKDRRSDIPALARHLTNRIATMPGMESLTLAPELVDALSAWRWPGNVRQMFDALIRAACYAEGPQLRLSDFPGLEAERAREPEDTRSTTQVQSDGIGVTLYRADGNLRSLQDIEADVIRLAIGHYRGRMSEVARRLGIGRSTLYRKLSDLGIETAA